MILRGRDAQIAAFRAAMDSERTKLFCVPTRSDFMSYRPKEVAEEGGLRRNSFVATMHHDHWKLRHVGVQECYEVFDGGTFTHTRATISHDPRAAAIKRVDNECVQVFDWRGGQAVGSVA